MKIGIITYWKSNDNYGQLLQCWALQQKLIEMGHSPFLIKYNDLSPSRKKSPFAIKVFKFFLIIPVIRRIKSKIRKRRLAPLIATNNIKNKQRDFDKFRATLHSSEIEYNSIQELQATPPLADVYITGSDQVWSRLLNDKEMETFFLNFGPSEVQRISYAASFSMQEYPAKLRSKLKENLHRFDAISVREATGKAICESVGYNAQIVLDPTLLLTPEHYSKLAQKKETDKRFAYIYYLNINSKEELDWDTVKGYCDRKGIKTKATTASGYLPARELLNGTPHEYSTIPQWLANIRDAEFVITTSFHGTVFSLLFHTRVIFIPLKGRHQGANNRVTDLFKELGMDFFAYNKEIPFEKYMERRIDWDLIDKKLEVMKEESIRFLQENIVLRNGQASDPH